MGQLEIKNFSLSIEDKILLSEINLSLKKGGALAIIGESGSGKTLLSKAILGSYPPKSQKKGSICFGGKNLLKLDASMWEEIRGKKISYISQNPMSVFNPMQTIGSHGVELLKSNMDISKEECYSRLELAFARFNLSRGRGLLEKYPFQLSGGMLQRVMLAMMMELSPELIIADEPTSALDDFNAEGVIEALRSCREEGLSLVVITHDYALMEKLAEEVLVMRHSRIVEFGSIKEILHDPKTSYTKELVEGSFSIIENPFYRS